ncbi:MAG: rhomboid family intramembrane serine protease [Gemmatimonadota bacterium]
MTPWVLRIIIANAVVYLLQQSMPGLVAYLALVPAHWYIAPWTLVTYMFLHGGFGHIFFNMLVLFFFGSAVETKLGGPTFLRLFLISGLVGGALSIAVTPNSPIPIIGASGGVFGVELAFAYFWPRQQIYIWGILPIEARWLVLIMTGMSLWQGMGYGGGGGIAHFAHLGGFLGAYVYLKWIERRASAGARRFRNDMKPPAPKTETAGRTMERWGKIQRDQLHEVNRDELDRILDKIRASGIGSLTASEREFLDRFSARL